MAQRCFHLFAMFAVLMVASCQRAQQLPPLAKQTAISDPKGNEDGKGLSELSWLEPEERRDLPILFVPDSSPEWPHLSAFWSHYPPIPLHLAQSPLEALAAIVVTDQQQAIKIKVPRGLPDPTPNLPPSNLPAHGKWQLGKKLFHERLLPAGSDVYACATCHDPQLGFANGSRVSTGGRLNTPSLINVAYNRRQFWDGRVRTLEETLVRGSDAEAKKSAKQSLEHHNWGGFVSTLVDNKSYNAEFALVFGVKHPTQDTVAQALATYMRTILSGDSLHDRMGKATDAAWPDDPSKKVTPEQKTAIAKGRELFHGKARCAQCHSGPLFTDHDYHNIGIDVPPIGTESGRAVHVRVGLKEARLIGAFRTPSLRNLAKSDPYFHDGSGFTLLNVVEYFDNGVLPSVNLAKALSDGVREQKLQLTAQERDALVMFLRSLEGTPVDAIVAGPVK